MRPIHSSRDQVASSSNEDQSRDPWLWFSVDPSLRSASRIERRVRAAPSGRAQEQFASARSRATRTRGEPLSPKWPAELFSTASCPVSPAQRVQVAEQKRQEEGRE